MAFSEYINFSKRQIDGEEFANFYGFFRKYEL